MVVVQRTTTFKCWMVTTTVPRERLITHTDPKLRRQTDTRPTHREYLSRPNPSERSKTSPDRNEGDCEGGVDGGEKRMCARQKWIHVAAPFRHSYFGGCFSSSLPLTVVERYEVKLEYARLRVASAWRRFESPSNSPKREFIPVIKGIKPFDPLANYWSCRSADTLVVFQKISDFSSCNS
ncbi:hypothetical protein WA026_014688 [Henosepilachna vigintioctopunctata]|uniref:Uncharacterized protein n=1 Tax=Henosepilachna vigintioctopunctata TaxID=420089 RepID=A0AAW1VGL6_9CUCU